MAGADYAPLVGTVNFPVGVNTVSVGVNPNAGASFATARTVVVTLAAGAAWVDAQLNAPPTLTLPYLDAYATSG